VRDHGGTDGLGAGQGLGAVGGWGGGGEDRLRVEQLGGSGDEAWLTVEGNVEPTVALADRPDG
jgi:hypothetical protein